MHVCVCCHPIYSGRQACGRTGRGPTGGRSHRISPPSFCGACLNYSREKDSAVPFPRRPSSRILCTDELVVLHLLGFYFFTLFFCEEKSQFVLLHRDSNSRPNITRSRGYQMNHRGDRLESKKSLLNRRGVVVQYKIQNLNAQNKKKIISTVFSTLPIDPFCS